jgi:hypothetical protein
MERLITAAGFEIETLERYYIDGPKFLSYVYRGVAHG